jgi:hypothetical protein
VVVVFKFNFIKNDMSEVLDRVSKKIGHEWFEYVEVED